jgi:hypothetical protein
VVAPERFLAHAAGVFTLQQLLAGESGYRAVSGLYRNTRQSDFFWFAFRRPSCWVHLDAETRSKGSMHVDLDGQRWGILIAGGAVVIRCRDAGPAYRRLHGMVEHGRRDPWPAPQAAEPAQWDSRGALRCRWDDEEPAREAVFDVASGLLVRTETAGELVELSQLTFDDGVSDDLFVPPDQTTDGFRGGTAYIQRDAETDLCSASWSPRSGPGVLHLEGPKGTSLSEAMEWARARTDDVRVSEVRRREL